MKLLVLAMIGSASALECFESATGFGLGGMTTCAAGTTKCLTSEFSGISGTQCDETEAKCKNTTAAGNADCTTDTGNALNQTACGESTICEWNEATTNDLCGYVPDGASCCTMPITDQTIQCFDTLAAAPNFTETHTAALCATACTMGEAGTCSGDYMSMATGMFTSDCADSCTQCQALADTMCGTCEAGDTMAVIPGEDGADDTSLVFNSRGLAVVGSLFSECSLLTCTTKLAGSTAPVGDTGNPGSAAAAPGVVLIVVLAAAVLKTLV